MSSGVAFAVVAMVAWGLWAVFATLATRTVRPGVATTVSFLAAIAVTATYTAVWHPPETTAVSPDLGYAVLAGVALSVGSISFYLGLATGRTSVVTAVSAMYFVVAAVVGVVVFGDSLSALNQAGVVLAAVAIGLLVQ